MMPSDVCLYIRSGGA